jgi:hypothetical protein
MRNSPAAKPLLTRGFCFKVADEPRGQFSRIISGDVIGRRQVGRAE